jgi:hypothetical protein
MQVFPVFVAAWSMQQQIFDGLNAQARHLRRAFRANPV